MSTTDRMLFRAAVFMIVRDIDNKILLQRRAGTGFMDGYYDFPSGHVDDGEGLTASAVRELQEETSLIAEEPDLQLKHLNLSHTAFPYINVVFEVKKWSGTPEIMEQDKCDDMQFFALDNLPENCTLAVRDVERAGFDELATSSYITNEDFRNMIGVNSSDLTTQ